MMFDEKEEALWDGQCRKYTMRYKNIIVSLL